MLLQIVSRLLWTCQSRKLPLGKRGMKVCNPVLAPKLESFQPEIVTEWNLLLKNQARWESERSYCETGPEKSLAVASNGLIFLQCALLNSYGKYCCCAFCRVLPWHVNCILNFTIFHVETNLFPTSWGNNIIFKLIFQLWTLKKKVWSQHFTELNQRPFQSQKQLATC